MEEDAREPSLLEIVKSVGMFDLGKGRMGSRFCEIFEATEPMEGLEPLGLTELSETMPWSKEEGEIESCSSIGDNCFAN